MTSVDATSTHGTVRVEPWPSELPFMLLVAAASLAIWAVLAISIIGLIYVLLLAVFFLFAHIALITYVRGSAVRLSPAQLPELHQRVVELATRAGVSPVPEAYVMQADGSLNAFATKFLRAHLVVLFTDLLDACGDDDAARDMIIGHELGHVRSGHLRWHWFLLPGMLVPFLGSAYSRAREFTCDRWGAALCGSPQGAIRGLVLLAAGRRLAPRIDVAAYIAQQQGLDTGLMTIGRWLSGYPPLSERVEAIGGLRTSERSNRGPVRAAAILGAMVLVPLVAGAVAVAAFTSTFRTALATAAQAGAASPELPRDDAKDAQVAADVARIQALIAQELAAGRSLPADDAALGALWAASHPGTPLPLDPYTASKPYGYSRFDEQTGVVFSAGPDGQPFTDDDIDHYVEPDGSR